MTQLDIYSAGAAFDAIRQVTADGREWWSARDLMSPLGYGADWRNFVDTIERAKAACANTDHAVADHFGDATKMVQIGSGAQRGIADFALTRYGAYLVAMNGDPRKPEIAAAQTYFAVKTREAEARAELDEIEVARRYLAALEQKKALEARVGELEPKAQAWDVLASADGDYSVGDAAKILSREPAIDLGERRLFNLLADLGWIYRQKVDGRWRVYQTTVNAGRLSELPASHYHPRTGALVLDPPQVRVTVKGIDDLRRRLNTPHQLPIA